ncbi:MAG: hypothetical protein ACQESN_02770 [Thermotogota bacterium]
MINVEEILYKIHRYGSYAVPYYNYVLEKHKNDEIAIFLQIALLRRNNNHEQAIQTINHDLLNIKNKNIYYLLIGMKMSSMFLLKREDYKTTYRILKKNLEKIPPLAREILKPVFLSIESDSNYFNPSRCWGEKTERDLYFKSFNLIGEARKEKHLKKKRKLFSESMLIAKKIPNPSIMITSLGNLQRTYKNNCKIKRQICYLSLYYESYYFDNHYATLMRMNDYLSVYEKKNMYKFMTELEYFRRIYSVYKPNITSKYVEMSERLYLNKNKYEINSEIKNYLTKISKGNVTYFCKKHTISRTTFYSILDNKIKYIKSNTIRKIVKKCDNSYDLPFEFKIEKFKIFLDKAIRDFFYKIQNTDSKKVLLEMISTYLAYPKTTSKSKKHHEIIMKIKKYDLKDLRKLNYDYKLFLLQGFSEIHSVYLKARKVLIKSTLGHLKKDNLLKGFSIYISSNKKKRKIIEDFYISLERFHRLDNINDENYTIKIDNNIITNKKYINALYNFNEKDRKILYKILMKNINIANQ